MAEGSEAAEGLEAVEGSDAAEGCRQHWMLTRDTSFQVEEDLGAAADCRQAAASPKQQATRGRQCLVMGISQHWQHEVQQLEQLQKAACNKHHQTDCEGERYPVCGSEHLGGGGLGGGGCTQQLRMSGCKEHVSMYCICRIWQPKSTVGSIRKLQLSHAKAPSACHCRQQLALVAAGG